MAQFGSALVWGARGRWFKSSHSDHFSKTCLKRRTKKRGHPSLFCSPNVGAVLLPVTVYSASRICDARFFAPARSLFRRFAPYKSSHSDHFSKTCLRRHTKKRGHPSLFCMYRICFLIFIDIIRQGCGEKT